MTDHAAAPATRRALTTLAVSLLLALLAALTALTGRAGAFEVGIADQKPAVFHDARIQALHVRYARLIVPWDAATSEPWMVQAWLDATAAEGMTPHVAFEHLRADACPQSPCSAPSVSQFRAAVDAFIARFPQVRTYTVWNEVNHVSQPVRNRPDLVAAYYRQLVAACPGCTVVAGDVLDSGNYTGWLRSFLAAFPNDPPQLWGIHNYSDVGRGVSTGTDAVLATVPGTLWMEETGGIVQLRGSLAGGGSQAAAEAQSAASIAEAFTIARNRPRIGRLYVYHVQAYPDDTFDSGLFRPDGATRPGYYALLQNLADTTSGGAAAAASTASGGPRPTVRVSWSKAKRRVLIRIRCASGTTSCSGSVRLSVRTKGRRARTWQVKTVATRSFRTTTGRRTLTASLPRALRSRMRRAAKRQAVVRLAQTQPATVTRSARRALPRP